MFSCAAKFLRLTGKPVLYLIVALSIGVFAAFTGFNKLVRSFRYHKKGLAKAAALALIIISLSASAFYYFSIKILYELPDPGELTLRKIDTSTKIYDRNGVLLYSLYKDENRTLADSDEIPQHIRLATLAAEDSEFFDHKGFSIKGITRAFYKALSDGKITGGSTITQQLVKNALLTNEKTISRKVKELILSVGVEHKYSKQEILTMYLNEVNYGGVVYGIKEAGHYYFDKELNELTIAEAALLAGLTKSPSELSPFGSKPVLAKQRQEQVLSLMQKNGYITQEQLERAKLENVEYAENKIDIKAPHFVMFVLDQLYRQEWNSLETGGLEVYTTLDIGTQKLTENTLSEEIESLDHLNVSNGASLVINPKNGEILAMVGSVDYFDREQDGNVNVTLMPRQPGSSIKPVNYAYAFANGYNPTDIIDDLKVVYKVDGQPDYTPNNYDGKYRGKITLRSALAESRNIPAVKILDSYGVGKMIQIGKEMGITTWDDKYRFGLSLTLGGGEVKLIDLAQVYQTLANQGRKTPLISISKIVNSEGKTVFEDTCIIVDCSIEAVSPEVAFQITNILSDNKARTPAFGSSSSLLIKDHPEVAVKTGTSNDLRDNLTLGYNQNYLVAVWVGNNDNTPMSRVASGITGASSIWNTVMTSLLTNQEPVAWEVPAGLAKTEVCTATGKYEDWLIKGTEPTDSCFADQKHNDKPKQARDISKKRQRFN